jgi:hypothetical protein
MDKLAYVVIWILIIDVGSEHLDAGAAEPAAVRFPSPICLSYVSRRFVVSLGD